MCLKRGIAFPAWFWSFILKPFNSLPHKSKVWFSSFSDMEKVLTLWHHCRNLDEIGICAGFSFFMWISLSCLWALVKLCEYSQILNLATSRIHHAAMINQKGLTNIFDMFFGLFWFCYFEGKNVILLKNNIYFCTRLYIDCSLWFRFLYTNVKFFWV